AGNVFMTEVGSRFDEGHQATEIGLRDLSDGKGKVELNVYAATGADNKRGDKVWSGAQDSAPGALTFRWDGVGGDGKARPRGRYIAELVLRDAKGQVVQKAETLFLQDSEAAQRAQYGEIEGQLGIEGGAGVSANTEVELVALAGNVVQRVRSTDQGNYRFKNVSAGDYRVRTRKAGWAADEQTVEAKPASAPAKVDIKLH